MFARVATFEGEREQLSRMVDEIRRDSESGPPEGVPAKEFLLLSARETGKLVAIALFESEGDLRQGDATLNEMSPPEDLGSVSRISVELFEVAARM